jgi:hypothetical protein
MYSAIRFRQTSTCLPRSIEIKKQAGKIYKLDGLVLHGMSAMPSEYPRCGDIEQRLEWAHVVELKRTK